MESLVQLEGDEWSLEDLPQWFSQLDHKVICEEDGYYLASSCFEQCAKSTEVWETAEQIVERINAAAKAFKPKFRPVQVGTKLIQIDEDGSRRIGQRLVVRGGGELRFKGGKATVLIDGKPPSSQPSRVERVVAWWEAEGHDSRVARALRVWLLPQQTWGSLYDIHEIIKDDMAGGRGRQPDAWKSLLPLMPAGTTECALKDQLDRFRNTANDYRLSGIHSRHGVPNSPPTAHPMPWNEAKDLIHRLLTAWLSGKI